MAVEVAGDLRTRIMAAAESSLNHEGNPCGVLLAASVLLELAGWLATPEEGAAPLKGSSARAAMETRWVLEGTYPEDLDELTFETSMDLGLELIRLRDRGPR